jgi:hypothetical protein
MTDAQAEAIYRRIAKTRSAHLVRVHQPLAMITQAPRSGGTLLLRLLDGHPQCHSIPHELGVGWPQRLPTERDQLWKVLVDRKLVGQFEEGFLQSNPNLNRTRGTLPFLLPPPLHRQLFERALARLDTRTDRGVYDAYFTGYFNAWLDCQSLYGGRKRWITAFVPRLVTSHQKFSRMLEVYPDARVLSIVRDPASWYASARRWSPEFAGLVPAVEAWRVSVESALRYADCLGPAMRLVRFDDLLADPKGTTRAICTWLGIRYSGQLRRPTFNGHGIKANSSFPVDRRAILDAPLSRADTELDARERAAIETLAREAYERALAHITAQNLPG